MMDKTQIENFLKANGVTHTAKEEEIRSVIFNPLKMRGSVPSF